MSSVAEIVRVASDAIFGRPLVTNVYRSILVEAMVASALPEWTWCSQDYAAYDFVHPDGTRLEVKQSALKQTWKTPRTPKPSWDIKERTGAWVDGSTWVPGIGRNSDIYVLGFHDIVDESADHRNPEQWHFFVIDAAKLPDTQRLSLGSARNLTEAVAIDDLSEYVADIHKRRRLPD